MTGSYRALLGAQFKCCRQNNIGALIIRIGFWGFLIYIMGPKTLF